MARWQNTSSSGGVRSTFASTSGKFGRKSWTSKSIRSQVGSGLEMTVKEQQEQGWVKHEKGEGEMTER